jgi:hypothetical protein
MGAIVTGFLLPHGAIAWNQRTLIRRLAGG